MLKRIALTLPLLIGLSGCYKVSMTNVNEGTAPGYAHSIQVHTLVYGLVTLNNVDVGSVCGDKPVHMIDTENSIVDVLINSLTFGIYQPVSVTVVCAD